MPGTSSPIVLRRLQTGLVLVVLTALLILLGLKGLTTLTLFGRPGELTWPAAANVYVARRVQQGGAIYDDWRQRPHVPAWYGPALYLPVAIIGRCIDADEQGLFVIGRSVSLLSVLGTTALIVWLLRRQWKVDLAVAAMMGLMFLVADGVLARLDFSFRADAPTCLLTVLGLALLVRSDRAPLVYGSAVVFLLAFLYKQSAVVGPPSAVIWLWMTGRWRRAGHYAAVCTLLFVGSVVLLGTTTGGCYFLNTVDALKGNTTLWSVPLLLGMALKAAIVPMAVGALAMIAGVARRRWDPFGVALALAIALAAVGTYRDGSDVYYYMLPLAIACLLCGQQLGEWRRAGSTSAVAVRGLTIVLALAALRYVPEASAGLRKLPRQWDAYRQRHETYARRATFYRDLARYLNGRSGPVLCQFNTMVLYCPRSILVDTLTFTSMADAGAFDDGTLIEQIRRGEVAAIVLNPRAPARYQSTDMFSRRWQAAMEGSYREVRIATLEAGRIFEPMPPTPRGSGGVTGVPR